MLMRRDEGHIDAFSFRLEADDNLSPNLRSNGEIEEALTNNLQQAITETVAITAPTTHRVYESTLVGS